MTAAQVGPSTKTRRGTTNQNVRGNVTDRRRRREWLVETFRADVDLADDSGLQIEVPRGEGVPAARCSTCPTLLTVDTVQVDRYPVPGCEGGTYRRDNIRPHCGPCSERSGGELGAARRQERNAS